MHSSFDSIILSFETPEKIIIRYARNTLSHHAKSITVICFIFICSFALSHTYKYIFLFFLFSFTLDSYMISLFLSFSLPHFHSFFSFAHIHSFYAQKTDNIQFDISYMRKRTKTKFAHYVSFTYIITIYMYIKLTLFKGLYV